MNAPINQYQFYPDKKKVGKKIQELRKKIGITASQLADLFYYDVKTINKWEQGRGLPSDTNLMKLAELFNCSVDEILCLDNVCQTDFRIDYFRETYSHSLIDILYDDFDVEIPSEVFNYATRQDYLFQKYFYSYLSKKETEELLFILKYSTFEYEENDNFNLSILQEIKYDFRSNKITSIENALFEVRRYYISTYKELSILQCLLLHLTTNINYGIKIINMLTKYERDMLFNFIINNNYKELYFIAFELFKQGAKLNSIYSKITDYNSNDSIKEILKKIKQKYSINEPKIPGFVLCEHEEFPNLTKEQNNLLNFFYRKFGLFLNMVEYSMILRSINCNTYYETQILKSPIYLELEGI